MSGGPNAAAAVGKMDGQVGYSNFKGCSRSDLKSITFNYK
jgi:hypothetical protein